MNNPSDGVLTLHLGLPKTASTWLQKSVFPAMGGIDYLGHMSWKSIRIPPRNRKTRLDKIFRMHPRVWDKFGDFIFRELIDGRSSFERGSVLISEEKIILPRFFAESATAEDGLDFLLAEHLERLRIHAQKAGFDYLRLLVLVRRQDHWLASRYAQSSAFRADGSQNDFESAVKYLIGKGFDLHGFRLQYDRLYRILSEVVGAGGVTFLPYEEVRYDRERFLESLSSGVGGRLTSLPIDEDTMHHSNVRSKSNTSWQLRKRSRKVRVPKLIRPIFGGKRRLDLSRPSEANQIVLSETLSNQIREAYYESNQKLAALINRDLKGLGYY
ncbi:hypothetical protein SAMN05660831_01548 [Thiohalospira halophila DSM 15071]|uniref:Sulfotransferase family protein n=1 Tax=Thiohalospira halophila DSM 15071 TaxID=1123397 RepID=A0A1I1RRN8_9GAMM|nr:hypothetical protein [Thiohalospira halophila]SFD37029.1 hypothetical protein SAMN05660831_01548 [Thiohalospira halophila DSM 15071]